MLICFFHIFKLNQLNDIQELKVKLIKLNLIIVKKFNLKYFFAQRATKFSFAGHILLKQTSSRAAYLPFAGRSLSTPVTTM